MPRGPANGNGDRVQNPGNGNSNGANPQALKNRIDRLRYKLRKVQASQVCGVLLKAFVWALGGEKLNLGLVDLGEDPSFRPEPSGNESEIACVDPTRRLRGPLPLETPVGPSISAASSLMFLPGTFVPFIIFFL